MSSRKSHSQNFANLNKSHSQFANVARILQVCKSKFEPCIRDHDRLPVTFYIRGRECGRESVLHNSDIYRILRELSFSMNFDKTT